LISRKRQGGDALKHGIIRDELGDERHLKCLRPASSLGRTVEILRCD
jgi:hypothetical protein